jgi:hypothetical protein
MIADRVKETTTSTSTSTIVLGGAVAGFLSFADAFDIGTTEIPLCVPSGSDWLVGLYTLTDAATLTRTSILSSSNGGLDVTLASGSKEVFCTFPAAFGNLPDVQIFTTAGASTWVKPIGGKVTTVTTIAGGGGGGSGRRGAVDTVRGGGSGGGGGGSGTITLPTSILGDTETVNVGAGGIGGAAVTANDTNGNPGTVGGNSTFGAWLRVNGGNAGVAGAAAAGGAAAGGAGFPHIINVTGGTASGAGSGATATSGTGMSGIGGGGGASISAANATGNGGNAGIRGTSTGGGITTLIAGATGGIAPGGNGIDGTNVAANSPYGGGGGGGGASSITGNAGNGGNAGKYGGGGGGGGAALNSTGNSGAGGNGADGIVIVITT